MSLGLYVWLFLLGTGFMCAVYGYVEAIEPRPERTVRRRPRWRRLFSRLGRRHAREARLCAAVVAGSLDRARYRSAMADLAAAESARTARREPVAPPGRPAG
ncbi:hypothetical protein Val02_49610 [Virgisporangium aliadipatigenens]|uniref:Uncharacterized protein n=1 Tax=Virgisporangium aliadipatigenens TaxID=741659 RepID=A0A8J3YQC8_9ACTN|nr:hypothetical protein [Virgisporangium aliadipatigenens]GIJ48075.1 hypothetical protein Val02_49610 [Virgisporangium aliadipatigenens]